MTGAFGSGSAQGMLGNWVKRNVNMFLLGLEKTCASLRLVMLRASTHRPPTDFRGDPLGYLEHRVPQRCAGSISSQGRQVESNPTAQEAKDDPPRSAMDVLRTRRNP